MKSLDLAGRDYAYQASKTVAEGVDQNMNTLIKAWDKEIAAGFEALRERGKQLEEQKKEEVREQAAQAHQLAADSALTSSIAHYLEGLAAQVEGSGSKSASIPSGIPATSGVLAGLLDELLANVDSEVRENWGNSPIGKAFGNDLMPKPQDMAVLMDRSGDNTWSERFNGIAQGLERLDALPKSVPQLQGVAGHERIDLLRDYAACLQAFGAPRLAAAILRPGDTVGPAGAPPPMSTQAAGIPDYLKKALDDFGAKATTLGAPVSAVAQTGSGSSTGLRRPQNKQSIS